MAECVESTKKLWVSEFAVEMRLKSVKYGSMSEWLKPHFPQRRWLLKLLWEYCSFFKNVFIYSEIYVPDLSDVGKKLLDIKFSGFMLVIEDLRLRLDPTS